jgi:drug/metabolite transporter (DMT)-like permease
MLYLLISIVFFAGNNVLWKKYLQEIPLLFLVGYRAFFTTIIAVCIFLYYHKFSIINEMPLFNITLGSLFGVIGLFSMVLAIKKTSLQWLGIYNLMGVIVTATYLYFMESNIDFKSMLWSVFIILGYVFYVLKNSISEEALSVKEHIYYIIMTFSFGISSILHWKNLSANVPAIFMISNQEFLVFITASFLVFKQSNISNIKLQISTFFSKVFFMAIVIFFALLMSFMGLEKTNPFVTSLLFLATPILTIVLGAIYFKEKITTFNIIALLLMAIGAFVLHFQVS